MSICFLISVKQNASIFWTGVLYFVCLLCKSSQYSLTINVTIFLLDNTIAISSVNVVIFSVQSLVSRPILDVRLKLGWRRQNIYYDLVVECVYLSHRSRQLTDLLSVRLQRVLHGILSARIILNMRRVASDSLAPGWLDLNIGRSNHSSGVTPVHTQRSDIDIQMDIFKSEFIRNWIHSTFIITERCWALRPWQLTDVDVTEFGNFGCLPVLYYLLFQ